MKRTSLLIAALTFVACTDAAAPPVLVETGLASAKGGAGSTGATVLPTFGGGAVAEAINDAGVVVGAASEAQPSRNVAGASYPTRWIRSETGVWVPTKLGAPGGRALSVNEAGDAVGVRTGNAIFWSADGVETTIGSGAAEGINSDGIVVGGSTWGASASTVPYVWIPNGTSPRTWTRQQLPLLETGGGGGATAINKHSVIVGGATRAGLFRAVKWVPIEGGRWSDPIPLDGTEPSTGTSAGFAINDNGDVAGYSRSCPPQTCGSRPYFWPSGGGSVNLASAISNVNSGLAYGIANAGHVVGFITVTSGNSGGPFSWNPVTKTLTDLGDGQASDINNGSVQYGREAVGVMSSSSGQRALVWRIP